MSDSLPAPDWTIACRVAALFARDPFGTGIHIRASAGPVRDRFLGMLRAMMPVEAPWRRCPASIADDRLLGGLDLGVTLASGQAVVARGLLAEAHGGIVVVGSAEGLPVGTAARLGAVLDAGEVAAERDGFAIRHPACFGLVLLDEGTEEDVPVTLRDRLAFRIDLSAVRVSETTAVPPPAEAHPGPIAADDTVSLALCATAEALGIGLILGTRVVRLRFGLRRRRRWLLAALLGLLRHARRAMREHKLCR
jgi:magnesium chelatase subunit D